MIAIQRLMFQTFLLGPDQTLLKLKARLSWEQMRQLYRCGFIDMVK